MDEILLNEEWANEAMDRLETTVGAWNAENVGSSPMRIVWGFADADAAEDECASEKTFRRQHGLLNWRSLDFDLFIGRYARDVDPESEIRDLEKWGDSLAYVRIAIKLDDPHVFPRSAHQLYNALADCGGSTPILCPRRKRDGANSDAIILLGLDIHLTIDSLNFRVLSHTLAELWWSREFIVDRLMIDEGFDHWNEEDDE